VILIIAVLGGFLLGCGAHVNRLAVSCRGRAGRSFLVPLGLARVLILSGLAAMALALVQARNFTNW
jgi:hypothetical protein